MDSSAQESVEVVLARTASRWRVVTRDITRVADRLREAVGAQAFRTLVPGLDDNLRELHEAVTRFETAAKHPEVVIATTGTTNSGKSTIANLLIGETLLPKAVQEMSAGVVTVHHDEQARKLVVEKTPGARWPTDSWDSIAAEEVQAKLESTMKAYRDWVGEDNDVGAWVAPPRFTIAWPTRMGRRPADFGLPAGARLTIIDLPGLKYVDDDLNGKVIREQARKALCLVAYNSEDADSRKQGALLRQVIDQVRELSGSPARMLFVLNRIDRFRTDRDPRASERAFTDQVTRQIREGIRKALSEYAAEADGIEPIPLSSEPALYAVLADILGHGNDHDLLRKIRKEYGILFDDKDLDLLPSAPTEWTETQRRSFITETRHQSRLDAFEKRLGSHIAMHLPEILLPDLVDATFRPARKALEGLDALVGAYTHRERKDADEAKNRLEALHQRLQALQKEALKPLNPLREAAGGDGDPLQQLESLMDAVPNVEAALGLAPGRLAALPSALADAVQTPLQRLNEYVSRLMEGEDLEDVFIQSAGSAAKLHDAVEELRSSPYGHAWKGGSTFEAAEAESVSTALTGFAKELSSAATSLVTRESGVQAERMKVALGACGEAIVNRIEHEALPEFEKLEFQGLRGIFRGTFDLQPPRLPPLQFAANVRHWSRTEKCGAQESFWVEKRVWWKLWLGKSRVKETRSVVRETTHEGIKVDKLDDLLEGFVLSGAVSGLAQRFAAWLGDSISEFDKTLERRLKDGVKTYRLALEQRMEEIDRGAQTRIESVEQHRAAVGDLLRTIERSRDWRGIADA